MKKLVLALFFVSLFTSTVVAKEYNIHILGISNATPGVSICENFGSTPIGNSQIQVEYVDATYDDVAQTLTIEVATDSSLGQFANFFHIILTTGDAPSTAGAADIYFDGTDVNNPKASAYVYNGAATTSGCATDPSSALEANGVIGGTQFGPDRVLGANSIDILEINTTVNPSDSTDRTYRLVLDVTNLNAHDAILDQFFEPYQGAQFTKNVGIWFWAGSNASFEYEATDNFLIDLETGTCAMCDEANFITKEKPTCEVTATANKIVELDTVTVTYDIHDPDFDDADGTSPIIVSFDNLPANAKPSVEAGGAITLDANGNGTLTITWTPDAGAADDYEIGASFTKDYGLGQLGQSCSADVTVTPGTPSCKEIGGEVSTLADQDADQIRRIANDAGAKAKKLRGKVGNAKPIDNKNANAIYNDAWTQWSAIAAIGRFFECSNAEFCRNEINQLVGVQTTTLASDINAFRTTLEDLSRLARKRVNKYKRALRQHLIQNVKVTRKGTVITPKIAKRIANRRANKKFLNSFQGNAGLNSVSEHALAQVDIHVANYGVVGFTCTNAQVVK